MGLEGFRNPHIPLAHPEDRLVDVFGSLHMTRQIFVHSAHDDPVLPPDFLRALRRQHPHLFTPRISLQISGRSLQVSGHATSFFQKQQVQEEIRRRVPGLRIQNQLAVTTSHSM